jgi:hypothetical protein
LYKICYTHANMSGCRVLIRLVLRVVMSHLLRGVHCLPCRSRTETMSFLLSFHPFKERVNSPSESSRRRPSVVYSTTLKPKRGAKILLVLHKARNFLNFYSC